MRREDLADLHAFIAVAREANFTRAAALQGTSQSALSHAVRRLEARLGVRLLTRTTRRVSITAAGEQLLARLVPAFAEIDGGLDALTALRDRPVGTIRITANAHAAREVLWPRLAPLLATYPEINLEIDVDSGLTDIVGERFDAGVRLGEQIARDMIAVRIGPDLRMAALASPAYLAAHGAPRTPQDLAQHRCINLRMVSAGGFYAWEFEKDARELRVRVDGQVAFNSPELVLAAARDGFGVGFALEDWARADLASGKLVRLLEDWTPPFAGYHLYYPSRRQTSPAFALVVEALRWRS